MFNELYGTKRNKVTRTKTRKCRYKLRTHTHDKTHRRHTEMKALKYGVFVRKTKESGELK